MGTRAVASIEYCLYQAYRLGGSPVLTAPFKITYLGSSYTYDQEHTMADILPHEIAGMNGGIDAPPPLFTWDSANRFVYTDLALLPAGTGDAEFGVLFDSGINLPFCVIWFGGAVDTKKGFQFTTTLRTATNSLGRSEIDGDYK